MDEVSEMLEINKEQAIFYGNEPTRSFATRIWSDFRNNTYAKFMGLFDIKTDLYGLHRQWLGDLTGKKILDLGCLRGNNLSIYMASNCKEYIGIDLSEVGISVLTEKLAKNNCVNAKAIAIDFLSPDFKEDSFDIIYAYGVMHHFRYFEPFLERLTEKLKPGGKIISNDPTETSWPVKFLRMLYRPFQTDKDWEWPFNKKTYAMLKKHFNILECQGFLGQSKWGIIVFLTPFISMAKKKKFVEKLHQNDLRLAKKFNKHLYRCMQVSLCMQTKKQAN